MTDRSPVSPETPTFVDASLTRLRRSFRPLRDNLGCLLPGRGRRDLDEQIRRVQWGIVQKALGRSGGVGVHSDGEGTAYLFHPRRILVEDSAVEEVAAYFKERSQRWRGTGEAARAHPGLWRYELPPRAEVPTVLDDLDDLLGVGRARPDHVLYVTYRDSGRLCPADEPVPPRDPSPVPAVTPDTGAGDGVRISVVDTGWWEPAETTGMSDWLHDVDGEPDPIDPGDIASYGGHGTFVSGVVRCLAPSAQLLNEAIFVHGGAAYESDITQQLNDAVLQKFEPHIISISAGTYSRRDLGLLAFEALWTAEKRRERGEAVLVVAAAGNDHTDRPFWPAAYPWVIGVGALDADGKAASYSNYGDWVDAYAQGTQLVNAFPAGTYVCKEPPHQGEVRHFDGMAEWSGTSFATPVVTGVIAAQKSRSGVSAEAAYAVLRAEAGKQQKAQPHTDRAGKPVVALGPPFA